MSEAELLAACRLGDHRALADLGTKVEARLSGGRWLGTLLGPTRGKLLTEADLDDLFPNFRRSLPALEVNDVPKDTSESLDQTSSGMRLLHKTPSAEPDTKVGPTDSLQFERNIQRSREQNDRKLQQSCEQLAAIRRHGKPS